jgi:hypothetical protein
MTNNELLAKIKAEIERRWKDYRNSVTPDQPKYRTHYFVGKGEVCEELLSFLDTLESEKPMNQDGLEEEIKRYLPKIPENPYNEELRIFAHHFAKWGAEHLKK